MLSGQDLAFFSKALLQEGWRASDMNRQCQENQVSRRKIRWCGAGKKKSNAGRHHAEGRRGWLEPGEIWLPFITNCSIHPGLQQHPPRHHERGKKPFRTEQWWIMAEGQPEVTHSPLCCLPDALKSQRTHFRWLQPCRQELVSYHWLKKIWRAQGLGVCVWPHLLPTASIKVL